jgi:hypothetical protein
VAGLTGGASEFAALSRRLKDAGEDGLRKELYKAIRAAGEPITREIRDVLHLRPYMPDRYADILAADIAVSMFQRGSIRSPGVTIAARGRLKKRKVVHLNDGFINHPIWPDGLPRKEWDWQNNQTGGMKPGFFNDPCSRSGPQVRDKILAAMHDVASKVTGGP